jgi:hypothetical protein
MIALNERTKQIAARVIWFEPAEVALADTNRFLSYALRYARAADMQYLRDVLGDEVLRSALQNAAPGIIDARSWAYWHLMLDMGEAPAMPERRLE